MSLLKIESLIKDFGKTKVLKGINLEVNEGEIISVLGPSGCGKSTLLRIISGILPLNDGVVSIKDKVVSSKNIEVSTEHRDINMVFQDFALWPHMLVKDNILYGLKIKKLPKEEMESRLNELVSLLHLEGLMNRYPAELSGGQQQRVAIARALITKPTIVLLDEPLCNLDIQLRVEMRTEMAYLFHKLGTTVFHVTHDPSEAFAMADKIIIMNQGVIDQMDTPMNCYKYPKTTIVAGLLGASNQIKEAILVSKEGNSIVAKIGGCTIKGTSFINDEPNRQLELRFRPESAHFTEKIQENSFKVNVVHSIFEGSCYRVSGELEQGERISFLHPYKLETGVVGYVQVKSEEMYCYSQINHE